MSEKLENESSWNMSHLVNIYTDGESYFYTLYNSNINRYFFDGIGMEIENEM
jgi:hypothetical protein